ncbi:MAG: (d)CMP kinase [Syntrophorhabdaceae bacterium]|nr:(d)CMP kinase [Syntrophorhabdaceae bacterium]MDD4197423.1 (d)CMP kinase [Syntrophorhabdaceae bacterium]
MTLRKHKIITIDGPSGAGKSTIAKLLAVSAGYTYIDSGAIYRGIAYAYNTRKDGGSIEEFLHDLPLTFEFGKHTRVRFSGKDISEEIREPDISLLASSLSQHQPVREYANAVQRRLAADKNVVLEGRDTGSVVFPDADIKFYLDARSDERAHRRHSELTSKGSKPPLTTVKQEMEKRDADDSTRAIAPLVVPDGAIVVDTTGTDIEGVLNIILTHIKDRDEQKK